MAPQSGDSDLLEKLYPVPLSTGIASLPGPTSASARALLSVLKHNYQTYHIFFNDRGFHKYVDSYIYNKIRLSLVVMLRIMYWPSMASARHPRS